jgi:hypothetical protein
LPFFLPSRLLLIN